MPEPSWTRIGTISTDKRASTTVAGMTFDFGLTDLYIEVYKVENDNRPGETNYACIPHVKQWPGKKLDDAFDAPNMETRVVQDWSQNDYGELEITDWGPTEPKQGSLDWSMGVSAGAGGAGGSISASYDTPYIRREITADYNETVAHKYTYPDHWDPRVPEADNDIVEIESIGEAWLDDEPQTDEDDDSCDAFPDILTVEVSSKFGDDNCGGRTASLEIEQPVDRLVL